MTMVAGLSITPLLPPDLQITYISASHFGP